MGSLNKNDKKELGLNDNNIYTLIEILQKKNIKTENIKWQRKKLTDRELKENMLHIGSYKNQLPTEVLSTFMEMEGVEQYDIDGGLTRYTAGGEFSSYEEAENFKAKLVQGGVGAAFIIATHKDELIPVTKAQEILAE